MKVVIITIPILGSVELTSELVSVQGTIALGYCRQSAVVDSGKDLEEKKKG